MENTKRSMPAEFLVPEVVQEDEVARYLGSNQPDVREFRVECGECGALSTINKVFFQRDAYDAALEELEPKVLRVCALFYHYAGGLNCEVQLLSYCPKCRKELRATLQFVYN